MVIFSCVAWQSDDVNVTFKTDANSIIIGLSIFSKVNQYELLNHITKQVRIHRDTKNKQEIVNTQSQTITKTIKENLL